MTQRIHQGGQVLRAGDPLEKAKAAMIMVHGRGASADDIIGLADELPIEGFAFLAPQAAGHTWYPYRFMEPLESNEPYLSSALDTVGELIKAVEAQGISRERIMLLGFSQGAFLPDEQSPGQSGSHERREQSAHRPRAPRPFPQRGLRPRFDIGFRRSRQVGDLLRCLRPAHTESLTPHP